jgi:hypothetical protein
MIHDDRERLTPIGMQPTDNLERLTDRRAIALQAAGGSSADGAVSTRLVGDATVICVIPKNSLTGPVTQTR